MATAVEPGQLSLDEKFFLRIACKNGLITQAEGADALRLHAKLRARGTPKPIQAIMLDSGLLGPEEVDAIHESQAASQVVRLDALYANIALRQGFTTREQLEGVFEKQRALEYRVRIGELLLERQEISPDQHRRVLTELLGSIRSDERAYMRQIRLKRRLVQTPGPDDLQELERLRLAVTEAGGGAPSLQRASRNPAPAKPTPVMGSPTVPARAPEVEPGPLRIESSDDLREPASAPISLQSSDELLLLSEDEGSIEGESSDPLLHASSGEALSGSLAEPILALDSEDPSDSDGSAGSGGRDRPDGLDRSSAAGEREPSEVDFVVHTRRSISNAARATGQDRRRGPKRRRRGQKPSGRTRNARLARFMESAIEALEESPELLGGAGGVQADDVEALETDLEEARVLVQRGVGALKTIGRRRSSDGSREGAFSAQSYLERKRRQRRLFQLLAAGVFCFVLLPLAVATVLGFRNRRALRRAEAALDAARYDDARAALNAGGAFWVGAAARRELADRIVVTEKLAPVRALRAAGQAEEALEAFRRVAAALSPGSPGVEPLRKALLFEQGMARGRRLAAARDLSGAVQAFGAASRAAPGKAAPRTQIESIRAALRGEVEAAVATLREPGAGEGPLEVLRGAVRRYLECFDDGRPELEALLAERELAVYLAAGDAARQKKDFDRARAQYAKAGRAAQRLKRDDAIAQVERGVRLATTLGNFQRYLNEGQRLEQKGRFREARVAYRKAQTWIKPESTRAMLLQHRIEETERAENAVQRGQRRGALWAEAVAALQQGQADQAVAALEAAREASGPDPEIERALALARELGGMVYVPAGQATIGAADPQLPAAAPPHGVRIQAMFIDRFEVTNRAYKRFLDAMGGAPPPHWTVSQRVGGRSTRTFPPERADHPVVNVTWSEAVAYARWAKKKLPTEEQWERAARGDDLRIYPWGKRTSGVKANIGVQHSARVVIGTRPVGTASDDKSPFGCFDMAGNVSEWTRSVFRPYPGQDPEAVEFDPERKVLRGGSWRYGFSYAKAYNRARSVPEKRYPETGFRCVREVPAWFTALR